MLENDEIILRAIPDQFILSFSDAVEFMKAEEQDNRRTVYFKASDETFDLENESILMNALMESKDYFLLRGNLDYSHYSKLPINVVTGAASLIPDAVKVRVPRMFELGQPLDVAFDKKEKGTLVKGVIYSGEKVENQLANWFWSTLSFDPPMKWFPSIGGRTLEKAVDTDVEGKKRGRITKVRWSNIGFTQEPINQGVGDVSTFPIGNFFKSFSEGILLDKAMTTASVAPVVKEDLEGSAGVKIGQIVRNFRKYYPVLKSWLCKKRGMKEEDAEKLLKQYFGRKILEN